VIDYDREARRYDATRGGDVRAAAAAEAVERLLPGGTRTVVDVACGTGIVSRRLDGPGRTVLGVDRSAGMLAVASGRLPYGVVTGDATRLPVASAGADAVVIVWLLHLLPDAAPVVAEAARVLRAGGVLMTTVDKEDAPFRTESDIAALTAPLRRGYMPTATDRAERVTALAAAHGLRQAGETAFRGTGQGRGPRQWREQIEAGRVTWAKVADPGEVARLCQDLSALPDQETARPDPQYRLISFS
jgi:SAM-dependent methyltransferase